MARNIQMQPLHSQPNQASRLKVEDALSYLDRVKQQFCCQPQVYNEFLDIMKEFKSQTIDTPGVISRVSTLFQGHKDLIVGFNTFLPVGYKIELNRATNTISIYHPGNKGTMTTGMSLSSFESMHTKPSRPQAPAHVEPQQLYSANDNLSPAHEPGGSGQPVEFNHAINYVNKIKNRYQSQPDIYKSFLDILHDYQKQQKLAKEQGMPIDNKVMEREVYRRVAQLFKDEPDLLQEFSQFLPDARASPPETSGGQPGSGSSLMTLYSSTMQKKQTPISTTTASVSSSNQMSAIVPQSACSSNSPGNSSNVASTSANTSGNGLHTSASVGKRKRLSSTASHSGHSSSRRFKQDPQSPSSKEVLAEISKYGSLGDFGFFDKVRSSLGESMYQDFLRCLMLYNTRELRMTASELMQMIHPFCLKMPELKKRMRQLLNQKEESVDSTLSTYGRERISTGEYVGEIDYASCKRYDVSYLALPKDHVQPKCSGRTALCQEVLNDTYVSFPSWSEDSSSVIKKTTAEEMMFRCEEDRYQLDIVLENMISTMDLFRFLKVKMEKMTPDERSKFKLDTSLGGRSECLHRKAIRGLYGESANTITEHLMNHPYETIPMVLKRLESKVTEWKEAKARNSKIWNEQNQKYYLKSLDHAGINFKQSDSKHFRSKALMQEIESAYEKDKRPPHLVLAYQNREQFVSDACSLVIHHVKRQANMHQDEKHKMKRLLKHFLPDFLFTKREPLSDDENAAEDEKPYDVTESEAREHNNGEMSVFFVNMNWYIFIRLHFLLCDRLRQFHGHAQRMIEERINEKNSSSPSTAMSLGLRGPPTDQTQNYAQLLRMIKSYLDGHMEAASFEEQLREVFTTNAYMAFTIDKLIQNIVRQLQHLVTDEICLRLVELYNKECIFSKNTPSLLPSWMVAEFAYQRKAERLLVGENCFKMTFSKEQGELSFELIPPNTSHANSPDSNGRWMNEVEKVIGGNEQIEEGRSRRSRSSFKTNSVGAPVMLNRQVLKVGRTRKVVEESQMEILRERYGVNILSDEFLDNVMMIGVNSFKRKYVPPSGSVYKVWRIDPSFNLRAVKRSEMIRKCRKEKLEDWAIRQTSLNIF